MYTHFLGLDVSKATLDVALRSSTCQVLATELLLTTDEFRTRPDAKRYASYAGVVPFERSSGQHRGRARITPPPLFES